MSTRRRRAELWEAEDDLRMLRERHLRELADAEAAVERARRELAEAEADETADALYAMREEARSGEG